MIMEKKEKEKLNMKKQWAKFIIVLVLYLLFLVWVKSWLGLIVVPFIYDAYISKKINWHWWKDREGPVRTIMSWVDAIVFALVAVYFINQFFFQNYVIPSSSLEKSLLTGDYLFVSKLSYGPRIPQTPLTMPLTQHTLPIGGIKSYIDWPHWDYRRVKGLGHVELNDIVVFNYPAGDTSLAEPPYQTYYYQFLYENGHAGYQQMFPGAKPLDRLTDAERMARFDTIYAIGRSTLQANARQFGHIATRPTDRRDTVVDIHRGIVYDTLNIPSWKEVHLKEYLEKEFGIPVAVNNDANCFAMGVYGTYPADDKPEVLVVVTLGTGVGLGIVHEGKLFCGANCGAGELCALPYEGSIIEDFTSKKFLTDQGWDGVEAAKAAREGNPEAQAMFDAFGRHLGALLHTVMLAYDPDRIALAGGIANNAPFFRSSMEAYLREHFPYAKALERLRIDICTDGDLPVIGASMI